MFIWWNTGGNTVSLGGSEKRSCQTCEKEQNFVIFLQYRYFALYRIFGVITNTKYLLLCDLCQRGWVLDKKNVEEKLKKVPIPFMYQYGLVLLFGLVALVVVASALGSRRGP